MFIAPVYPPALNTGATATAVEFVHILEQRHELARKCKECYNIEKALLCHVQQVLDGIYIKTFIDYDTDFLSTDISVILEHLLTYHRKVSGEEVKLKEAKMLRTQFMPSDPFVTIWNPIEKLEKISAQANLLYTEQQKQCCPVVHPKYTKI